MRRSTRDEFLPTLFRGDSVAIEGGTVSEAPFGPPGSTAGADGTVVGSHVYGDNGSYTVTVCVMDDDGAQVCDTLSVTVDNVAPVVDISPTAQIVQYSDLISVIGLTANDVAADPLTALRIEYSDGGAFQPVLPAALSLTPVLGVVDTTWSIAGNVDVEPKTYVIRVVISDDDGGETTVETTVEGDSRGRAGYVCRPAVPVDCRGKQR